MTFTRTYNHTVLELLAARASDPNSGLAVFLGRNRPLVDELNDRWNDATNAAALPSPTQVLKLLAA